MSTSHFIIDCLCGCRLKPHDKLTKCPKCGRVIEIEWPAKHTSKPQEKTISEAYEQ